MPRVMNSETLIELLRYAEYKPQSYSGRFMYGAKCVGVVISPLESLSVGAKLARAIVDTMFNSLGYEVISELADDIDEVTNDVVKLMRGAREDSMGRDVIVYWPDVEWKEGSDD